MPDPQTVQQASLWLTSGLPALTSLLGAAIGTSGAWFFAVRKLRRERAFDSRLEYYAKLHEALVDGLAVVGRSLRIYSRGDITANEVVGAMKVPMAPLHKLRRSGLIYSKPAVILAVEKVFDAMRDELAELKVPSSAKQHPAMLTILNRIRDTMLDAAFAVADEAREHMGSEQLDRNALKANSFFATSGDRKAMKALEPNEALESEVPPA